LIFETVAETSAVVTAERSSGVNYGE